MNQKKVTTSKSKMCFGMQNIAEGGFYLPFFDYDIEDYSKIVDELRRIQLKYFLSDIYVFKSNHGYNAFSLDKLPYNIFKNVCEDSILMCDDYKKYGLKRGSLTLRFGLDKKFVEVLAGKTIHQKSLCHAIALEVFYFIKIITRNKGFDSNMVLRVRAYRSEKDGFLEVSENEGRK